MANHFDVTVVGSGPGGYVAAIRAAQLGYRVALVEKYPKLGGTCTNVGCIPSKALLDSTEHYHTALHKFKKHGIELQDLKPDFVQMLSRKEAVVTENTSGLAYLMKKNKITVLQGTGSFLNEQELAVQLDAEKTIISSDKYIIATGSKPASLPTISIDKARIISSTEALSLPRQPASMVVIGGGVIGAELASVYARIGTKVMMLEYANSLIPSIDKELGRELKKILTKLGINIQLQQRVLSVENLGHQVRVSYSSGGETKFLEADYALLAVGRKPYTQGLGLENTAVQLDKGGFIKVNEQLQTHAGNIYAIGDVIGGAMLAHKAEEEGVFVAEHLNGQKPHIRYHLIPAVVYTWPEVASVGYTEEELKGKGIAYRTGKFPFAALGRARAAMDTEGFVKVLVDQRYGEVLGVHIIGARAADLIAQAVVAMEYEVNDEAATRISYAHPTYSEALKEAYLMASGKGAINI